MNIGPRLTETVSRKTVTGRTDYADPLYGDVDTFAARIERGTGEAYSAAGSTLSYSHRIFCQTAVALTDLVFFPEDDTNDNDTGKRPASVQPCYDLGGTLDHYEVLF